MNPSKKKEVLAITGVALAVWGFLLFFENAYFAAGFYGVNVPSWASWVGEIPIVWFNVIDTIAVVFVILAVVLTVRHRHRRTMGSRAIGAAGAALLLVFLVLLAVALFAIGLTLPTIIRDLKGFLGV